MNLNFSADQYETVAHAISRRRTFKVIGNPDSPVVFSAKSITENRSAVLSAIHTANLAPFHYDRQLDGIAEPWRVNILWHDGCQVVAKNFYQWFDDVKPGNKLPAMLSGCGACVMVTWLPQFKNGMADANAQTTTAKEKQIQIDQEHLAATSAFVQNLLLLLTAKNFGTYWSSGGQLRQKEMMNRIGMAGQGELLAAVFVEFPDSVECGDDFSIERIPGKLADKRSPPQRWSHEIKAESIG